MKNTNMKLLHFTFEDGSLNAEYIVLTEDESGFEEHARPGFKLHTVADVEGDNLHRLPSECGLYRQ